MSQKETQIEVDLATADQGLDLLDAGKVVTFQTFADLGEGRGLARVVHGTLSEHAEGLVNLNKQGVGIFVMVNEGDGIVKRGSKTCRTAANVVRVRALFVDLDGAPIRPVLEAAMPPDWIVESSPGRWHAYWRVDDCPLWEFERMQSALATKYSGDPTVKDLPRVMRVPGFIHHKREPFVSRLYLPAQFKTLKGRFHHE